MLKTIFELWDGTRISSGAASDVSIKTCTTTECVNGGTELVPGSVCCTCLEAQVMSIGQKLGLSAGDLFELTKTDDAGTETHMGIFRLEALTKKSDNIYKLTAYDNVSKLDKDLTEWLKGLGGWPYELITFAGMVCTACGVRLVTAEIPNGDFPVQQFFKSGVTGRQIMQWIGEIACRFCRANADGDLEFDWYTSSGVTIRPGGERYFFSGALSYEDYDVAAIDAVKLRLADGESGALWPDGAANNPYVITGNAILLAMVTEDLPPYLEVMREQLSALPVYRPCKVSLPASLDIRAGHTVQIVDKHGNEFTTCVMTKTQTGQRDTLECTGSARRDSATAANNKTAAQIAAEQEAYSQNAAQQAVENQSWESLFNKWTNGGQIQGIFAEDGAWGINAAIAKISNLIADMITAGNLKSTDGKTYFDLDTGKIVSTAPDGRSVEVHKGNILVLDALRQTRIWVTQGEHNYIYLCDGASNIRGGIGVGHGYFQIMAPEDTLGGQVAGHAAIWKKINGEMVLCASE